MKRRALIVITYPMVLLIGWIATRLSERMYNIDQLEFDFEDE